jgi:methionyl-tRNA formyltransferase
MLKVVILSPIWNSLYSLLVAHLCMKEKDVALSGIVVRKVLNLDRIKHEWKRDGDKLLMKVYNKLFNCRTGNEKSGGMDFHKMAINLELRERSLIEFAENNKIPVCFVNEINDKRSEGFIRELKSDVIAFTGGGLVRDNIFTLPRIGVLNVHSGSLPLYRGMDTFEWALLCPRDGKCCIGVTLHIMDKGVDTGPIIMNREIEILKQDTLETINKKAECYMVETMMEGIRRIKNGRYTVIHQKLSDGKQYFYIHPRIYDVARTRLKKYQENL